MPMAFPARGENAALVTEPASAPSAARGVPGVGGIGAGEEQSGAPAIDVAARADALDDLLSGVAALGVADVGAFERGFVRDLVLVEIGAEPGNARLEAQGIQRVIADGRSAPALARRAQGVPLRSAGLRG